MTTLLNSSGFATPFKLCRNPQEHQCVTFYRLAYRIDVCDLCNESPEWFAVNLWRYCEKTQRFIRETLGLQEIPLFDVVETLETPEIVESIECIPDIPEGPVDVVERCSCGEIAEYVGMDGEPLCEKCWAKVLISL